MSLRGRRGGQTLIQLSFEDIFSYLTLKRRSEKPLASRSKMRDDVERNLAVLIRLHETFDWDEIALALRAYGVLARDGSTLPVKSLTSTISSLQRKKRGGERENFDFNNSHVEEKKIDERPLGNTHVERRDATTSTIVRHALSTRRDSDEKTEPTLEEQLRESDYRSYDKYIDQEAE